MNLKAKLAAALSGTTAQTAISTETLAEGHTMRSVKAELMAMYQARQVMCCEFFKGDAKPVVKWWLVGAIPLTPTQLLKSGDRKRRAAKRVDGADGDE